MKKYMQKIISIFSAIFIVAGLVMPAFSVNASSATFNTDSLDVSILQIANSTKDKGTFNWTSTASADANDEIAFLVYYHNTSSTTAQNTKIRINLPSGSASSQTISTNIWADNANSIYGSTTLNLSSSQSLSLISGSVKWYPNQNSSVAQTLPSGQTGDEITSNSGLNIGDIAGGWSAQGYLTLKARVSNNTTTVVSAPSVSTNSATSIGTNSATLNSSVNPNNASTSVWFEYGTSSGSLSNTTATQSLSSSATSSSLTAYLSNLSSNTTYYFRAVAQNSAGTTYGSTLSFTTSTTTTTTTTSAPSVTTYAASSITSSAATLNGIVNPNNASTSVWFEYGTSSGSLPYSTYTQNFSASSDSSSFAVTSSSFSSNTTYYFRAVAQNSAGTTYGSTLSFTTSTTTTTTTTSAPAVTTNSATSVSTSSATLNASVNPNNASTSTWFEYGTSSNSFAYATSTQNIGSGSANVSVNASLSSLSSNTTYYFRVVAQNSAGTTYGSTLSFTTSTTTTTTTTSAPSVTTYAASSITSSAATLNGIVNPNNASTSVWFEYGTSSGSLSSATSTQSLSSGSGSTNVSAYLASFVSNTTYYFRAVASNSAGTTYGSTLSFVTAQNQTNTSAPSVTANAATSITSSSANLNSTINPNGSSTDVWYEYGLSSNELTQKSSTKNMGSGSSYDSATISVTGLSANTVYYFRPVAKNSAGTTYGAINNFTTNSGSVATVSTSTTNISNSYNITGSANMPFIEISESIENQTSPNGSQASNFANIGDRLRYAITLKNSGGATGYNLKTSVQLPSTLKYLESSPKATYDSVSNVLSWNVSRLRSQETTTLYFTVEVVGGLNSTIQIQSQVYIPVKRLNVFSNTVATIVSHQRPVSLKFTVDQNEVKSGDILKYSVIIKNINNYEVRNVLLSIGLPENVELQEADFSASSKSENSLIVDLGNIAANNEVVKTFSVRVGNGVEKGDILTAVTLVNYQDATGNNQPVISASASSTVTGSLNLAASIFGGIASFSVLDWLTLFGILIFILVVSYTTRSIMKRVAARRQA